MQIIKVVAVGSVFAVLGLVYGSRTLVQADQSQRRAAVTDVVARKAPELLEADGTLVEDWEVTVERTSAPEKLERVPCDRADLDGRTEFSVFLEDDLSAYEIQFTHEGISVRRDGVLLDGGDTGGSSFTVGAYPALSEESAAKVQVQALGKMLRTGLNPGVLDLEVETLTFDTADRAIATHDAVAVFVDSDTVSAFFYQEGEAGAVLHFVAQPKDEPDDSAQRVPDYYRKKKVCQTLYKLCVEDENVTACGHWLDHCFDW